MIAETITVQPTVEPVSIEEVRQQEGIDTSDDDVTIHRAVIAARKAVAHELGRVLISTTFAYRLNVFPAGDSLWLPSSPLISVTSVVYDDAAGDSQTLATTVYDVDTYATLGRIYLKRETSQVWPGTQDKEYAVVVTYKAGYGTAPKDVPENIRQAILLVAAHLVVHREAVTDEKLVELPMGVRYLLSPDELVSADS